MDEIHCQVFNWLHQALEASPIHKPFIELTNPEFVSPTLSQCLSHRQRLRQFSFGVQHIVHTQRIRRLQVHNESTDDIRSLTLLLPRRRFDTVLVHQGHTQMNSEPNLQHLMILCLPVLMKHCQPTSPDGQINFTQPAPCKIILHTKGSREAHSQQNHTLRETMGLQHFNRFVRNKTTRI